VASCFRTQALSSKLKGSRILQALSVEFWSAIRQTLSIEFALVAIRQALPAKFSAAAFASPG